MKYIQRNSDCIVRDYDNGIDTSIGKSMYSTLQTELNKVKKVMGENIEF